MRKRVLFVFLACLPLLAAAQDYAFKVLVNKGKTELKSGTNWQPMKVGTSLNPTDEIKLSENSYVGLVHVSGKPMEIKQAGSYKVVDLAGKVNGGATVLNKYTDFILSENTQKKNTLVATGAVHRGENAIRVYLPEPQNSVVFGSTVIINWDTEKVPGPYVVTLSSMFGDELQKIETKENMILLDLYDKRFQNEDNILVDVHTKTAKPSKEEPAFSVKKISKADRDRINTSLNEIKGALADESALNKLVLAGFYEQNHLLVDAITAYLEAIKLAPDVPAYKDAYQEFLVRNNMKPKK